ncbi:MAG: dienelactone hydrolase family protein [Chloroflexi bacterium]|nr:dienelactone hydrolase family protein [Chloroflexota bacterium]
MASEWVSINVGGKQVDAYLAQPDAPGPHPGVVVAMHVFGVDRFVQEKCDELAQAGYAAIAPYLFHRSEVTNAQLIGYAFEDPARREVALPLKDSLRDDELIPDMLAGLEHLRGLPEVSGPFGVTGFCIGGRIAYMLAVRTDEFTACADFYGVDVDLPWGDGPTPLSLTADLDCALTGFFGDLDANPAPPDVDKLEAGLRAEGKPFTFHRYPNGQHAFNDPYNPVRYDPEISADSWPKLIGFFDGALKAREPVA